MNETTSETGATVPVTPTPIDNVTPVTPETPEFKPAEASQADIEAASAPEASSEETPTTKPPSDVKEDPTEVTEEKTDPEASTAEKPQAKKVTVSEGLFKQAVDVIRKTNRSSIVTLQYKLNLKMELAKKLLDVLTERGVLGAEDGVNPRKILIPVVPPKQQLQKKVAQNPSQKHVKGQKKPMHDYDRLMSWKKHLAEIGHYTDEAFIEAMGQYALANPGYNPMSRWGSTLIVMVNRLSGQLLDGLRTFTQSDADYLQRELIRFFSEKPLGDNPETWNTNFTTNGQQKEVINKFFRIDAPYRELRGRPEIVMTAVRNAAWPNPMEERNGTGGTFAERFHYLAMCIVRFATSDHEKALFENSFHTQPTQNFMTRLNGGVVPKTSSWIKDGKCGECGSDLTKDSKGNTICSNPICPHNIASTASEASESFRYCRPQRREERSEILSPDQAPQSPMKTDRRQNWKNKKRHDRREDDDGGEGFRQSPKRHGKKFRVNDNDDEQITNHSGGCESTPSVFSCGASDGGAFGAGVFDALDALKPDAEAPVGGTPQGSEAPAPETVQ